MSHQTGIQVDDDLRKFFATCNDGHVRVMKIIIEDEQMKLKTSDSPSSDWESDYDAKILPLLEPKQPCYILYRLDVKTEYGYKWVFISWSPDHSHVRQKMLYAGTRATIKREFGDNHFQEEIFGTAIEDVNLKGYKKSMQAKNAPAPLTASEEELKIIKQTEVKTDGVDTKHVTLPGIAFPISEDAIQKLLDFSQGTISYVQLSIDVVNEQINLEEIDNIDIGSLRSKVPSDHPRYHLFNYKHKHNGEYMERIVFIYSMPGYSCSIKERMLYSSCKAPFLSVMEDQLKMDIEKKLEIDKGSELTEEYVYSEVHPKQNIVKQAFAKPKGPGGRGPRRITKPSADS
ncbi:twinfilin-1-like [Liolophura sinensis]|uniref:twinfilin-1-like n=1 Tax=Liolophura sinensis TaxID=3198878 RepID=UPI0031586D68